MKKMFWNTTLAFGLLLSGVFADYSESGTGDRVATYVTPSWAQSFTPGGSGTLSQLRFKSVDAKGASTVVVKSGSCNGTTIFDTTLTSIQAGDNVINIPSSVSITSGTNYFFSVKTNNNSNFAIYFSNTSQISGNLFGDAACSQSWASFDMNFGYTVSGDVSLTKFPKNKQLYGRNPETNKSVIPVEGSVVNTTGYQSVKLEAYRSGSLRGTKTVSLSYGGNGKANFQLKDTITAELQNYSFKLYGVKSNQSTTLLSEATEVVSGDVYVIQGQSNAEAVKYSGSANGNVHSFLRTYGSGDQNGSYAKQWFQGQGDGNRNSNGNVGQWGIRLGKMLIQSNNIPIAVFNGAHGGMPVEFFARNNSNPLDLSTNYGRLLSRLTEVDLKSSVRAVLWHQGESNISKQPCCGYSGVIDTTMESYMNNWKKVYQSWKSDFSSVKKFYIMQIRIACKGKNTAFVNSNITIQEAHRQLSNTLSDVEIISTNSADHHTDQCHYPYSQYAKFGEWAHGYLMRDLYNQQSAASVEPPQVTKVVSKGNTLSLWMKHSNDVLSTKGTFFQRFRLEGASAQSNILHGKIDSGKVVLTLSGGANPTSLSYVGLPGTVQHIVTNQTGMGLVAFYQFPITPNKLGCTNEKATNYDSTATEDDGTCKVEVASLEQGIVNGFQLYSGQNGVHIYLGSVGSVTLYHLDGAVVYRGNGKQKYNVSGLNSGLYFANVMSGSGEQQVLKLYVP